MAEAEARPDDDMPAAPAAAMTGEARAAGDSPAPAAVAVSRASPGALPPAARRRRRWRIALGTVAALIVAPFLLTLVYAVVPPVSTLMVVRWLTLQPVTRDWVSFDDIAPVAVRSVVASEDARFCLHNGIDTVEFGKVVDAYMDGEATRGASTIPMQVVKNLFLWPGRDVARKALEMPLALWLDLVLSKRRIAEIYLNIAEWGPDGTFGIEAGAQRAFGIPAAKLSRRQAALMAAVLPNPVRRNPARPSGAVAARAARVAAEASPERTPFECLFPGS